MSCRFVSLAMVVAAGSVFADVPAPVGQITLPGPGNANTFYVSSRYSADGRLYVWDGANVLYETTPGARPFTSLSPGGVGSGSADTGGINFTSDGSAVVVGNGAGGLAPVLNPLDVSPGLIFTIPTAGGSSHTPVAKVNYETDFIPLPTVSTLAGSGQKMLVDAGSADYLSSSVSIVSLDSGVGTTSGTEVIASIPGAGASLAMDSTNRLYVCVGYGADQGDIRRFDWSAVQSAFQSNTPLNWADGELFNPDSTGNNNGAGMFFDSRGFLFAGGSDGVTVFAPDGVGQTYDLGLGYVTLTYNPATDQFFAQSSGNTVNVYDAAAFVPEPATLLLPAFASLWLLRRRQHAGRRLA
ncbi:MAG: hypothetical protein ABSH20_17745 [Tepidisphaeraceae bacterium]|jgi:hypothetical protein